VPILEQSGRHDVRGSAPALFPNAQRIESPTKSLAVYGYLAPDETLDAFEFTVSVETSTTLDMLVPVRADLPDFRPTLTLFGDDAESPIVIVDPGAPSRSTLFEPFSLSNFYQGGSATVALHPGVRYVLVVEPGTGTDRYGPYTIGVSGGEQFTFAETRSTLAALPAIWSGAWAGAPARPEALTVAGAAVALVAFAAAGVYWRRRRSRAGTTQPPPPRVGT
jgi:hypothetical protein